ncbi:isochorismatase family protein [Candidatus Aalborgicola defluviihabitans]|jgi:nicotinamidase-related amidase|uniref:isochorismatase family protein n=1 Tax=Candidatus Aalborgicola defluviihabitans TaxID=3386187 RepID=UPI001DBDACAC|nr:isochorismatase family protein [Burkholderiales bacterium]MBK7282644.1 isochorismatase family protein [Burkholderiales bacterium]MBL0245372.1 isochorismatase family protein [Rhodoferax sp.]
MLLEVEESQLVLVDYQGRLMPAMLDGPAAVANAVRLLRLAALLQVPTFVTEQNPSRLGASVSELQEPMTAANARVLSKMQFSAVEEGLGEWLRPPPKPVQGNARSLPKHLQKASAGSERGTIVVAGCEAHVCLLQTALNLLEDEFDVWVVTDACSSRTERNRDAAFDRLAGAGAELVTTEMVAFEWIRSAEHPDFKAMQALIK